jgi:curved DNA-binding protein CbpA
MEDPYKILGVSQSASDEEVKAAYRSLAKKYHPDSYANNPLADLAVEKMKEINTAYEQVTKMRSGGGSGSYGNYSDNSSNQNYASDEGYSSSQFRNIRDLINANRTTQAQSDLDSVPASSRNAEWHFLKGCVRYKAGWVNEAYMEFQNAIQMDPSNQEYRQAFEQIKNQMSGGFGRNNPYGGFGGGGMSQDGCNGCDICTALACANCLCGGMGGGC